MNEVVFIVEEAPEGGYIARALGHSIYTEADTWSDLKTAAQDAVICHWDERELMTTSVSAHCTPF